MPRLPDPRFATDCTVTVDGRAVPARTGESIASALLAAGRPLLSRSAKYHRPRGPFCLSGSCGSCLVRVDGEPNQRACRTPCRAGLRVETQNGWPDAGRDLLGLIDPLTPHGLDVHHMLTRPLPLNRALVAFTRRLAGSGRMPDRASPAGPVPTEERVDALVLGSGPAGLAAAEELARGRRRVLLVERDLLLGGRLRAGLEPAFTPSSWTPWAADVARAVAAAGGEVAVGTSAVGLWHDGGAPVCLLVGRAPPRTRLLRADRILVCTGGHARPPVFEGADLPGVYSGRALALALAEHGVMAGLRAAVLGGNPEAHAIADRFRSAGIEVALVDATPLLARGRNRVTSLRFADGSELRCDTVAQGAAPAPAPDLLRALGVGVDWDRAIQAFAPRVAGDGTTPVAGLFAAGEVARPVTAAEAAAWGRRAGEAARG
jgi:sarcosine oxidase subunit alpha